MISKLSTLGRRQPFIRKTFSSSARQLPIQPNLSSSSFASRHGHILQRTSQSLQKMKKIIPLSAGILLWQLRDNMAFCQVSLPVDLEDEGGGGGGGIARGLAASLIEKEKKKSQTLWERLMEKLRWLFQLFSRCVHLLFNYSPALISSPALLLPSASLREHWWTLLVSCIRSGGPCGVKFAQWLSTRPDLFPADLCRRLQALQSYECSRPLSLEAVRAVLSENLGSNWSEELSVDVDSEGRPIVLGEGAVAQVLRGELRLSLSPTAASKRAVAIKLIRPEVEESIKADLSLILMAIRTLELVLPRLNNLALGDSIEQFQEGLLKQLDMQEEARNLHRFRQNFFNDKTNKKAEITFPEPIPGLVGPKVLVEGLESGPMLRDFVESSSEEDKRILAKLALQAIFQMTFLDSFVHADLHPGNILCYGLGKGKGKDLLDSSFEEFDEEGKKSRGGGLMGKLKDIGSKSRASPASASPPVTPHLCFLDAGLTVELTEEDQNNMVELSHAIALNDGEKAARLLIEKSRTPERVIDAAGFTSGVKKVVQEVTESRLHIGKVDLAHVAGQTLQLCHRHNVKADAHFVRLLIALGVAEGIVRKLDPELWDVCAALEYVEMLK
eukprot:gene2610-2851_t